MAYTSISLATRQSVPLLLLALALVAQSCAPSEPPQPASPRPRNVLLLVADTLRADRLGCYGYPRATSPNIDELAASGTLYTSSYSQACWTVPSMISLMSGVSVTKEETRLPAQFTVLGETLRAHGLETAAFLANATLTTDRGFERGFEHFEPAIRADAVTLAARFSEWHGARDTARPFFAWVHFIDPHHPYAPAPLHDVFREPRPDQEALVERWRKELPRVAELSPKRAALEFDDAVDKMVAESNAYDGEVLAVDDGVGRILETLRASGELDTTLVIFCSDHGEMLYEHRAQPFLVEEKLQREDGLPDGVKDLFASGHRAWYFEDLWNTPLIFSGPGFLAGARLEGLAANLDLYPTILEALDVGAPPQLQGESLWRGAVPKRERVFASSHPTSAVRERSGKKLIVYPRRLYMLADDAAEPFELFDLASDPLEQRDLSATHSADAARLFEAIETWRAENDRAVDTQLSPEQRRALIQMGYVGEGKDAAAAAAPKRVERDG